MRIGEVAAASGVSVETLRFYERRNLLTPPARTASGYREYPDDAVQIVRFIKHGQDLGFALDDIAGLLRLADGGPNSCDAVRDLAQAKIDEVADKIDRLVAINTALHQLLATCDLPRADRQCPLLADIDHTRPGRTTSWPFDETT